MVDHTGHASHIHISWDSLCLLQQLTFMCLPRQLCVCPSLCANAKRAISHGVVTEKCNYARFSLGASFFTCQMPQRTGAGPGEFSAFPLPFPFPSPTSHVPAFSPFLLISFFSHFLNIYIIGLVFSNPTGCHKSMLDQRLSILFHLWSIRFTAQSPETSVTHSHALPTTVPPRCPE